MMSTYPCACLRSRGAAVADAQRAGFTAEELFGSGFGPELWGHDGAVLAILRNNANATWKNVLRWDVAAASAEVKTWTGVSQVEGGFVVELSLQSKQLGGAWQP